MNTLVTPQSAPAVPAEPVPASTAPADDVLPHTLKAGKSSKVTIEIPAERRRYWDKEKKQYVVEPGDYEFLVGAASDDIRLELPMTVAVK